MVTQILVAGVWRIFPEGRFMVYIHAYIQLQFMSREFMHALSTESKF